MEEKEAAVPEDVVVTLEHSSFGKHVFRAQEADLAVVVEDEVSNAHAAAKVRAAVAAIDAEQAQLASELADCDKRIEAARVLNDSARIAREEAAKAALQEDINTLAQKRAEAAQ